MLANKRRDTKPELRVRRLIHAAGLRYQVDAKVEQDIRSRADIVFRRRRIAVFIDGCFWHRCPEHATDPKANSDYWEPKLRRNRQRDAEITALLTDRGWLVLRFWEHQPAEQIAEVIESSWRARSTHAPASEFGAPRPERQGTTVRSKP